MEISIYVDTDGTVTITDLFGEMLPLVADLNPEHPVVLAGSRMPAAWAQQVADRFEEVCGE